MSGPNKPSIDFQHAIIRALDPFHRNLHNVDEGIEALDILTLDSVMVSEEEGYEIKPGIHIIFTDEANSSSSAVYLEAPDGLTFENAYNHVQGHIDSKPHTKGMHGLNPNSQREWKIGV